MYTNVWMVLRNEDMNVIRDEKFTLMRIDEPRIVRVCPGGYQILGLLIL